MFQTKNFQIVCDEWYARLKKSGFEDIENEKEEIVKNQKQNLEMLSSFKQGLFDINISYYSWAESFLFTSVLKSQRDRIIWIFHSQGLTGSEIGDRIGLHRTWINKEIEKIKKYLKASI